MGLFDFFKGGNKAEKEPSREEEYDEDYEDDYEVMNP